LSLLYFYFYFFDFFDFAVIFLRVSDYSLLDPHIFNPEVVG
jgi:hypothetical protein